MERNQLIFDCQHTEALEHYATLSVKAGFVPDPRVGGVSEGGDDLTQAVAQA